MRWDVACSKGKNAMLGETKSKKEDDESEDGGGSVHECRKPEIIWREEWTSA